MTDPPTGDAAPGPEPGPFLGDVPRNADRIWTAAVPPPRNPPTPRAMILNLFGRAARGGPGTNAAAQALGVSQRTVQRWVHDRKAPERSAAAQALRTRHQEWRDSPQGRRSALGRKRRDQIKNARRVHFTGTIRISHDQRPQRRTTVELAPEVLAAILERLEAGDDDGALAALEDGFGDAFGGSLSLAIDRLEFE